MADDLLGLDRDELREIIAALRAEVEMWKEAARPVPTLRAEVERLRAALEPFAALASEFGEEEPDTDRIYCKDNKDNMVIGFLLGDVRQAAALAQEKQDDRH